MRLIDFDSDSCQISRWHLQSTGTPCRSTTMGSQFFTLYVSMMIILHTSLIITQSPIIDMDTPLQCKFMRPQPQFRCEAPSNEFELLAKVVYASGCQVLLRTPSRFALSPHYTHEDARPPNRQVLLARWARRRESVSWQSLFFLPCPATQSCHLHMLTP